MLPGCGWCDDDSGTGLGKCMQGGKDGPFPGSGNSPDSCSKPNWNFIGCPGNFLLTTASQWKVQWYFNPHGVLHIQSLARDIVLCSLARLCTLTVPLSTQVLK